MARIGESAETIPSGKLPLYDPLETRSICMVARRALPAAGDYQFGLVHVRPGGWLYLPQRQPKPVASTVELQ